MLRNPTTPENARVSFDHYLQHAMKGRGVPSDSHLSSQTVDALNDVARTAASGRAPSIAQVATAKAEFARFLTSLEIGRPETGRNQPGVR